MQKEKERAARGRVRLIEGLAIGNVKKLDVGKVILFNGMGTLAGDSCPSTRPHTNLFCVPDIRACTCSMYASQSHFKRRASAFFISPE